MLKTMFTILSKLYQIITLIKLKKNTTAVEDTTRRNNKKYMAGT